MNENASNSLLETIHPCEQLGRLKLVCFDVDGVMTDGGLYYGPEGQVMLRFHVADGMGLKRLMSNGIAVCIISQSNNQIIASRAKVLGIEHCYLGVDDKFAVIEKLAGKLGIELHEVGHIADDLNDMTLMEKVGVAVTVPAGVPEIRAVADFVTSASGGNGAVRELCEAIIESKRNLI